MASEPGIQMHTPNLRLDSGFAPFGAPRNDGGGLARRQCIQIHISNSPRFQRVTPASWMQA
jgi:hypothetical protein